MQVKTFTFLNIKLFPGESDMTSWCSSYIIFCFRNQECFLCYRSEEVEADALMLTHVASPSEPAEQHIYSCSCHLQITTVTGEFILLQFLVWCVGSVRSRVFFPPAQWVPVRSGCYV